MRTMSRTVLPYVRGVTPRPWLGISSQTAAKSPASNMRQRSVVCCNNMRGCNTCVLYMFSHAFCARGVSSTISASGLLAAGTPPAAVSAGRVGKHAWPTPSARGGDSPSGGPSTGSDSVGLNFLWGAARWPAVAPPGQQSLDGGTLRGASRCGVACGAALNTVLCVARADASAGLV